MGAALDRHLVCLLLLACLLGASAGPSLALARPDEPGLSTLWPIDLAGNVEVAGSADAIFLGGADAVARTHIEAEEVLIETVWERGMETAGLAQVITADDVEQVRVPDAEVRFDLFQDEPRFLAHVTSGEMLTQTTLGDTATLLPGQEEYLVRMGSSPDAVGGENHRSPSFWYATAAPTIEVRGGGTVIAEGSFTVYVNDVVIHATGTDTAWSNWTGYRKADPGSPAGEYEWRVTTIQVTNGTFVSGTPDGMRLFLPSLTAQVEGLVTTFGVTGELEHGNKRHIFRSDPLALDGDGTLSVSSALPIDLRSGSTADRTMLSLLPTGSFQMTGAGQVEVIRGEDRPYWSPLAAGGIGSLALLAMLGLMVMGIVPAPSSGARRHQSALWQRRGQAASLTGHWTRAATYFMLATRFKPDEPVAWYEWAHAELAGGHPEKAEAVAVRAADVPGIDPLDILDLRASAAWERGDEEAFQIHLRALAEQAPEMAQGLIADLGVDSSAFGLGTTRTKEDLDGYA